MQEVNNLAGSWHNRMPVFKSYWGGLVLVLACYVLVYGLFLWLTDFIPYVMDNNESFSSLGHAYNLYHGDLLKSFGLTDEAFSPFPDAHPVIHSHQGNWPRIYAFVLFALGARSIESQIFITTFTIGIASLFFVYHYFARFSIWFSVLASIILMTDYILFAQWNVVTYRVWHAFFVFSSLLCVHGLSGSHKKWWIFLTALNAACLFYGELVFAGFVTAWTGLYTLLLYFRKSFKNVLLGGFAQFTGMLLGVGILFMQLSAYMGFDTVIRDFKFTLWARNEASDPVALKKMLMNFYDSLNVAFFYNILDGAKFRDIISYVKSFFMYGFQIYTPVFSLIVLISFILGFFIFVNSDQAINRPSRFIRFFPHISRRLDANEVIAFLFLPLFAFWVCITFNQSLMGGLVSQRIPEIGRYYFLNCAILSILSGYLITKFSKLLTLNLAKHISYSSKIVFITAVFLLSIALILRKQPSLYNQDMMRIWFQELSTDLPISVWKGLFIFLVFLFTSMSLVRDKIQFQVLKEKPFGYLSKFLISGFIAYTIVYILSPGYVYSGYLTRYAPFYVFLLNTIIALGLFFVLTISWQIVQTFRAYALIYRPVMNNVFIKKRLASPSFKLITLGTTAFCCMITCSFLFYHWFFIQYQYINLLPPTHFGFVKMLREPEFYGKSSVSNTYSMPFSVQTNSWSYFDDDFDYSKFALNEERGYRPLTNLQYFWFRDRKINPQYSRPELYICFNQQNFESVMRELTGKGCYKGCSHKRLVSELLAKRKTLLNHEIIKRDESVKDSWTIVKLDWNFPPYLGRFQDREHIHIKAKENKPDKTGAVLAINYHYKQQDGKEESASILEVFRVLVENNEYEVGSKAYQTTSVKGGEAEIELPLGYYVVVLTPHSNEMVGNKIMSKPFEVSEEGIRNIGLVN